MTNQTNIDECIDKVAESGILPLSMDEIRQAINDNRELLRSRSSDILAIIYSLNEKMKKNPVSLIDSAYGVKHFDTVKKQIRAKNNCLCHFVKDEDDYIPYLLEDLKLFFSPPSNFHDKADTDFRWIRDMLNVTCEPGSEITFEEILDLIDIDDTSKKMAQAAYAGRWAFTEVAQDICRTLCLCADTDDPRMWE